MKILPSLFGLGLLVLSPFALAGPSAVNNNPMSFDSTWDYVITDKGERWFVYYDSKRGLFVQDPAGAEARVGFLERPQAQAGLELGLDEKGPVLMWRDKLPSKGLYVWRGADKAIASIGEETFPLPRMKYASTPDRDYYLWYGEHKDPVTNEIYNLHFRAAGPDGKELSPVERVLPGIYPLWIVDDQGVAVFSNRIKDESGTTGMKMAMRMYDKAQGRFSERIDLFEMPGTGPIIDAYTAGERWFLVWLGIHDTQFKLELAYSDNRGMSWQRHLFEDLDGVDVAKISFAGNDRGNLIMAVSGPQRNKPHSKHDVYILSSSDKGSTWSKPYRLRNDVPEDDYHARNPSVRFAPDGKQAIVVWEDWQDIRGAVFATVSQDAGKTWDQGVRLTELDANYGLPDWSEPLHADANGYQLMAERYRDDRMKVKDVVQIPLSVNGLTTLGTKREKEYKSESHAPEQVRKRVEAYWTRFVQGDFSAAYDLLDPYFRADVTKEAYLRRMGRIKYHGFELAGDPVVKHNVAFIPLKFNASVPGFEVKGKTISRDEKEYNTNEIWVFVDSNWYRLYYEESTGTQWAPF